MCADSWSCMATTLVCLSLKTRKTISVWHHYIDLWVHHHSFMFNASTDTHNVYHKANISPNGGSNLNKTVHEYVSRIATTSTPVKKQRKYLILYSVKMTLNSHILRTNLHTCVMIYIIYKRFSDDRINA